MRAARQGSRLTQIGFLLFALTIGFLGAEGVMRLFAVVGGDAGRELGKRDPLRIPFTPHGRFGYRQRANDHQTYPNGAQANWNSLSYRGPKVTLEPAPGVLRVVLLGGSATHGYGVNDDETIDAHMRRLLVQGDPDRSFEVVNLALGGYDSYQVYERMNTDGIRFAPDLVIINSGVNDVRNSVFQDIRIADPRTLLWEVNMAQMRSDAARGGPSLRTRLNHYFYLARLPSFVRSRLSIKSKVANREPATLYPDAADYFEKNIRRTIDIAREVGAQVLLATPASSLRSRFEPTDTSQNGYWINNAETTQKYRDVLAARLVSISKNLTTPDRPIPYVAPDLGPDLFLDDCHLTGDGNREVAREFVNAMSQFLDPLNRSPSR